MTSRQAPAPPDAQVLGRVLLPLRAFLGFTFCFAGLQKLANPRFFDASDPASIQAQLAGAAHRSPIHALISPLTHVAVPLGIVIAFGELAVGVGTLLGLRARLAAAGGVALSLMLFLTVSFHAAPYYTGADIVFAFAWTPLLLAGSGPVLSLDAAIADWAARRRGTRAATWAGNRPGTARQAQRSGAGGPAASRRQVLLRGTVTAGVAVASLVVGGLAAGLGRLAGGRRARTPGRAWRHRHRTRPGQFQPRPPPLRRTKRGRPRRGRLRPARPSGRPAACPSARRPRSPTRPPGTRRW